MSAIFPLCVICDPAEGVPLELGTSGGGQQTIMVGLPGREISLAISSAMWMQYTNVTDGQTDREADRHTLAVKITATG